MFRSHEADEPFTFAVPAQRRSQSSVTVHRIVAARASAVVLDREGLHEQAERLRAEADRLEQRSQV